MLIENYQRYQHETENTCSSKQYEQLQGNGHYSESNIFGVMPLFVKSIIYFNVAHYSKIINKDINTKLEMFAHHGGYAVARLRA